VLQWDFQMMSSENLEDLDKPAGDHLKTWKTWINLLKII